MTAEELEYLDKRYPLDATVMQEAPQFFPFSGTAWHPPLQYQLTFSIADSLSTIEGVAFMYYQFDKFMKERYGNAIKEYQDAVRAKRIDLTQTEPGTDTGEK